MSEKHIPAGMWQLVKKVRWGFFDKLPAKWQNITGIIFCHFGRCGG